MASCGFTKLVGGPCGSSADNPENVECVVLGTCSKDIQGHLFSYRVYGDPDLDSEAKLILARCFPGPCFRRLLRGRPLQLLCVK